MMEISSSLTKFMGNVGQQTAKIDTCEQLPSAGNNSIFVSCTHILVQLILCSKVIHPPLTEPLLTPPSLIYPTFCQRDKNSDRKRERGDKCQLAFTHSCK